MTKNEFDYRKLHYVHCAGYGVIKKRKVPCNFVLVRGKGRGGGVGCKECIERTGDSPIFV